MKSKCLFYNSRDNRNFYSSRENPSLIGRELRQRPANCPEGLLNLRWGAGKTAPKVYGLYHEGLASTAKTSAGLLSPLRVHLPQKNLFGSTNPNQGSPNTSEGKVIRIILTAKGRGAT